ncbi:TIGR03618 family F420-dependent PPOX class oxidoreductase [Nocardioides sp. YIM 123512]|uniref:TIGR03618 family F420-dependent PPOX class oxidoreductase n=1 Tax=Nocardioides flavescens TaxID=2691959 RepID=A0A6L7EX24_9ACTN|nr:TIGR03618 family F420-dependent PPOX class oxidoreductase [Nocardioides flavescens]
MATLRRWALRVSDTRGHSTFASGPDPHRRGPSRRGSGYRPAVPNIATNTRVERDELLDFVRTRHHLVLVTTRSDGRPQVSPVTGGVDAEGRIVISTYPDRAKATNLRRDPRATVLVLSDEWDDAWVQVDGAAEVLDMPSQEAEDGLVEYFRCIAGEHSDWDEYRAAMRSQGKSLIRITPERWGPVATGGFPPDRVPSS